jgi:hypothetical protein
MGMEENFPPRQGSGMGKIFGSGAGKQPPHILCPVDIPNCFNLSSPLVSLAPFSTSLFLHNGKVIVLDRLIKNERLRLKLYSN